jgi:hypothetical protein
MPRMPSLRRPVMDTMKAEALRIRKRQERAQKRLDRAVDQWGENPDKAEAMQKLEEDAALTEREVATLEAAAKVAALLERVPEKDEDDEKPLTDAERAAAVERMNRSSPTPLTSTEKSSEE